MSMSNCIEDMNSERIVTLCDMTGGLHTFNIGIDETFEILGEKVKEKLELEKNKYDIYFFNREGTEKRNKNDKVEIVNSEVDLEPDYRFLVNTIKSIPKCIEENEVYDLEIVHRIEFKDICGESKKMEITQTTITCVSEDSFVYSVSVRDSKEKHNYLCTLDENKNSWISTKLPENVFHVYPDGSYIEDERLYSGNSYNNTTVYTFNRGKYIYLIIKNKDDQTEITDEITDEIIKSNYCFDWCFPIKNDKYLLFNSLSHYENCKKLYIVDADTSLIINIIKIKTNESAFFIDDKHIGLLYFDEDKIHLKINFMTGEIIDVDTEKKKFVGTVFYNKEDNTYRYKKNNFKYDSLWSIRNSMSIRDSMFSKGFVIIHDFYCGRIDILKIKND